MIGTLVEFFESLGYTFQWSAEEERVHINCPSELTGIECGYLADSGDIAKQLISQLLEFNRTQRCSRISEFVRNRHIHAEKQAQAKLIGGPFDGELIPVTTQGQTHCRKIRDRWWAAYIQEHGELFATFRGYATSEVKAKTKQYSKTERPNG